MSAPPPSEPVGKTVANLFDEVAEEHLIQPTIIYEFPIVSPLSKQKADQPDWTERWEIFAGKMEIANGFSELNDPEDQRRRFEQQLKERERGDEEAHQMDEDYIRALSYGMPPAGGVGVGVDRLAGRRRASIPTPSATSFDFRFGRWQNIKPEGQEGIDKE